MIADDYRYCETLVRDADKDRFLSALFAPAERRDALFALHAFQVEISRIPRLAREPFARAIRLQWWRDTLNGERVEEAAANPVASALIDALRLFHVSPAPLIQDIDRRHSAAFGETVAVNDGANFLVAAQLLGADASALTEAANHAGAAYALAVERSSPDIAGRSYDAFRAVADELPKAAKAAFLPAALVPLFLRQLDAPQWRRQIVLLRAAWFGFPNFRR